MTESHEKRVIESHLRLYERRAKELHDERNYPGEDRLLERIQALRLVLIELNSEIKK